jgi:hypothetical protein
MLNKLWTITWYAHIGASLLDPRFSVRDIGRYSKRAVLAEYRIRYYDGKIVRFTFKDYAKGGKTSCKTLRVNTFIGRLIRHIPDKHFPLIRHAGLFANGQKNKLLTQARAAIGKDQQSEYVKQPSSWAERQTAYRGVDPLLCPNCQVRWSISISVFGRWEMVQFYFTRSPRDDRIPLPLLDPLAKPG